MKELLASVDAGKYHTCNVAEPTKDQDKNELMFKTRVREIPSYDPDIDHVALFENKYYAIGEDDGEVDTTPSKLTFNHKLCTLYGITRLFPDMKSSQDVYLITTCPYNQFESAEIKAEYKDFYIGSYELEVNDNKLFKFKIVDVLVMPESSGVVHSNAKTFKDELVGVIDWGGLQVNCMIYDNRKMIKSSGFTRQLGGYSLETKILNTLNSDKTCNYQEYEIKYILKNKSKKIKDKVDPIIENQINKIISDCRKQNWNFDIIKLLWTGGSSLRFKDTLNEMKYNVSENAIMDNARGNLEVGKVWLKKIKATQK